MAPDARCSSARFAVAIVATLATLSLVAAPPALAQLNFTSTDVSIFGNTPQSMVASDFDSDSHLDLATADNGTFLDDGGVDVLLGAGDGSFTDVDAYRANDGPTSLAAGDFNADTHTDLAVANGSSGDVSVLLGAGDGTFGAPTNLTGRPGTRFGGGRLSQRRCAPRPRGGEQRLRQRFDPAG